MENTIKTTWRITANKKIKKRYLDTENGQLHYWTAGSGPALLFIHQSTSSVEEYAALVPYLAHKYLLIAFDLPGHGNSYDPETEPGVEEFTDAAISVLDHLKITNFSVVGHHGGALMSMNLGYRFPDRVEKVILSGTSGIKTPEETKEFAAKLAEKKKIELDEEGQSLVAAWQRFVEYMPNIPIHEIIRPYLNSVLSRIRPYDAHHAVLKWNREKALASLHMPVLLLQGTLDMFVSHQENLLELLPNAQRQVIDNGGAFLFFDKAKECSKIIDTFLSEES